MANWFEKIKTGAFRIGKEVTCKKCGENYNPVEHQDCPHCELMKETVIMSPAEAAKARGGPSLISRYMAENDGANETGQGGLIGRYGGGDDDATSVSQAVNGLIERFSGDGSGSAPNAAVGGGDQEATLFFTPTSANEGVSRQGGARQEPPGQEETGEQSGLGSLPTAAKDARPESTGLEQGLSLEFDQGLFSSGEFDLPGPARSGKTPSAAVKSSADGLADDASNPVNWGTIKFDAAELTQSGSTPDQPQPDAGLVDAGLAGSHGGGAAAIEMNFSELLGDEAPTGIEQSPDAPAEAVVGASPTNAGGAVAAPLNPGATDKTVISTAHRAKGVAREQLPAEAVADDPVVGWVVVVDGPGKGYSRPLGAGINSIGRSPDQQVPLYFGAASDKEVSRSDHLHVVYDAMHNTFKLQHGKSRNLSYLNDQPVLEITELKPYDRVRIGNTTLVFVPFCGDKFTW